MITGTFGSEDRRARVLNDGTGYLPGGVIRSSRPGGLLAMRSDFTKTRRGGSARPNIRPRCEVCPTPLSGPFVHPRRKRPCLNALASGLSRSHGWWKE